MNARPTMKKRARVLHLVCQGIARDIARGIAKMRAYRRGASRYNRSLLARGRGKLSVSAIRWEFSRWSFNPSPSCFLGRWGNSTPPRLTKEAARELGLRAIRERLLLCELYRIEAAALPCSASTLYKKLTGAPFRAVWSAHRKLIEAQAAALAFLEARTGTA